MVPAMHDTMVLPKWHVPQAMHGAWLMPWCPATPYFPCALCPGAGLWHNGTKDSLGFQMSCILGFQNDMHDPSSVTRNKQVR